MRHNSFPDFDDHSSFDKRFDETARIAKRTIRAAFFFWVISAIFSLGVITAIVVVALHFLSKVW